MVKRFGVELCSRSLSAGLCVSDVYIEFNANKYECEFNRNFISVILYT